MVTYWWPGGFCLCVCVCVCVCVPLSLPRAPPTCPPSNQSTERPFGPRDRGAAAAAAAAAAVSELERRWGRVTCVHTVGLSSTPAVVKSVTDGPFSEQASSEKLIDKVSPRRHAVKRFLSAVLGLWGACGAYFRTSVLSNETTEKCQWKCCIQTLCLRRFVPDPNLYVYWWVFFSPPFLFSFFF